MKLLFVNDDGINSPFLHRLYSTAVRQGHEAYVCAPSTQQSTTSHSYHTHGDIRVTPCQPDGAAAAWAVDGTPVDCVRIALRALCPDVDAVFSGVNLGYNTGWPVYASGTVGAAREAVFSGVPGIAVSAEPRTPEQTLDGFICWSLALAQRLPHTDLALQGVWNLNAPCVPADEVRAPQLCRLHPCIYRDAYDAALQPDGTTLYRLRGLAQPAPVPDTDLALLQAGHITCTLLCPEGEQMPQAAQLLPDLRDFFPFP